MPNHQAAERRRIALFDKSFQQLPVARRYCHSAIPRSCPRNFRQAHSSRQRSSHLCPRCGQIGFNFSIFYCTDRESEASNRLSGRGSPCRRNSVDLPAHRKLPRIAADHGQNEANQARIKLHAQKMGEPHKHARAKRLGRPRIRGPRARRGLGLRRRRWAEPQIDLGYGDVRRQAPASGIDPFRTGYVSIRDRGGSHHTRRIVQHRGARWSRARFIQGANLREFWNPGASRQGPDRPIAAADGGIST